MGTYNQYVSSSVMSTSYFQGIIKPWDEYILVQTGEYSASLFVGDCKASSGSVTVSDCTIYSVTRSSSSYNNRYTVSQSHEDQSVVNITYPYYVYSNCYDGAPVLSCSSANSIQAYFVCFAVLVYVFNLVIGYLFHAISRRFWRRDRS